MVTVFTYVSNISERSQVNHQTVDINWAPLKQLDFISCTMWLDLVISSKKNYEVKIEGRSVSATDRWLKLNIMN